MTVRIIDCFLIAALATSSALAQPEGFNYDESKVPDFTLPDQSGDPVRFSEVRGKDRALILFHRSASW